MNKFMLFKLLKLQIIIFLLFVNFKAFSQATTCATANPFCTGSAYNFPASTGSVAQGGPDYNCLLTQPNPCWYFLQISTAGSIVMSIASVALVDIDFVCWGPYTSFSTICNNLVAGSVVDCSYSTAAVETCVIPNAQVGEFYMICITNFSGAVTNITFSQTAGTGATNCNIVTNCVITSVTAVPSACDTNTNTYSVSGIVTFNNPPVTGVLTITDCSGSNLIYNPFFASPINYTIPSLTANGAACYVTASFSASSLPCTLSQNYTAPPNCSHCHTPPTDFSYTTPTSFPGASTLNYIGTAIGAIYIWDFDSGIAVPGTGPGPQTIFWPTGNRTYTVTLAVSIPGCDTTSATHLITVPSSIDLLFPTPGNINLTNFPNPFSNATAISYNLAKKCNVTLSIFDLTGKEITNLVNQTQPAGEYNINFNSNNLTNGVYYYRLILGNVNEIGKMVIIK